MDNAVERQNVFPKTRRTWMGQLLEEGELLAAKQHIMEVYAEPLRVYCRGCTLRWVGDPRDLVGGFFADRLSRPAFLQRWLQSGRPLRFWLIVGFKHYMLELARQRQRDARISLRPTIDPEGSDPDRAFDQACAVQFVRQAIDQSGEACRTDGLADHWDIFLLYHIRSVPMERIAADMAITVARASVMKRTAVNRFRATLRELISWNGADDELIDAEIRDLQGGLG